MEISIYNFKAIKEVTDFSVKSLNIISGVNSSGKSSFIQFLLLLKQTLESKASNRPLILDSESTKLGEYSEVVYQKKNENPISTSISFKKEEFHLPELDFLDIQRIDISVVFNSREGQNYVQSIKLNYYTPEFNKTDQWLSFTKKKNQYLVETNAAGVFSADLHQLATLDSQLGDLSFIAFFPQTFTLEVPNPNYPEFDKTETTKKSIQFNIKGIENLLTKTFSQISYIGPLREAPVDIYTPNKANKNIGSKGEFAAFFLEKEAGDIISFHKMTMDQEGRVTFNQQEDTLAAVVKYWICDIFGLAKNIKAEKYKENYVIKVTNHFDIETTIKHVGFGVSQILPIVVEGLRMPNNGILILEQPEIHLHPKIQSLLFDFLHSLSLSGKRFIVETHSDHLITRMRRRIAEDLENILEEKVNLVFVEEFEKEHIFRKLDLTELGSLSYFPKDFVEQTDSDYRAIVKAQAVKRSNKNKKE